MISEFENQFKTATHNTKPEEKTHTCPNVNPQAQEIWRVFHWSFFSNVQALIIALQRFRIFFDEEEYEAASTELNSAATLLCSSGAAMHLGGNFSAEEYKNNVRSTMVPPHVKSDNFSGLLSWEHAALMLVWRKLRPIFSALPEELEDAHKNFVSAYYDMAVGHVQVCEKFVGDEGGSIRFDERSGIETLKRFTRNRMGLIDPKQKIKGCPFSA